MVASVNRVIMAGVVGRYGFTLKYLPSGSAVASGSITVSEPSKDGRTFESFFQVQVYGRGAEAATEIGPGTPILLDGKLSKHKTKSGEYETVVSCYAVQALQCATQTSAADTHTGASQAGSGAQETHPALVT
jgi:single-stranded DNA-binding protein